MSSTMRGGTCSKLSQNNSTIAAIIRLSAVEPGRFSSRLMVGCEHRSAPLSGSRPTAILNAGSELSASQSLPPAFAGAGLYGDIDCQAFHLSFRFFLVSSRLKLGVEGSEGSSP